LPARAGRRKLARGGFLRIWPMNLTLKQLRYFAALAETMHFGRAAALCHVTQPALSMQIKDLEKALGVTLVERTAAGLLLTWEGEEVARRADAILLAIHDLSDLVRHRRQLLTGRLRLGVIPSVGPYLLPRLLPRLHGLYPELSLSLRESQTQHLLDDLIVGKLDLLILALPVLRDDIETMELGEDRFTLAVSPEHPLAGRAQVSQAELASERLLLLEEGHCLRDQALALCGVDRDAETDAFRASSLATVIQMVGNGYGCTILPELAVPIEANDQASIRIIPFAPPAPSRMLGLAWRRSSPRKRDFMAFGRFVIGQLKGAGVPAAQAS
jgi:LysR family hydrogen peroxide-inducible transcriptional activator